MITCTQLNTEFGTDDNTEQFKLHTTDTHKRKRIIIRRKFYKKDSSIDILTQYTVFLIDFLNHFLFSVVSSLRLMAF